MKHLLDYLICKSFHITVILCFACIGLQAQGECFSLDFETVPESNPSEGLEIGNQYLSSNGVIFELEDGQLPRMAQVGLPVTAFNTGLGNEVVNESQTIGSFFLTDDGVLESDYMSPIILTFSSPLDSISGLVLDVDAGERFVIEAMDDFGTVIEQTIIAAGDPGTGDGRVTRWGFNTMKLLIHSLKISGTGGEPGDFGFGLDNFVTCPIDASNIGQGGTTSTEMHELIDLKIYPNPSSGDFTIEMQNPKKGSIIELYDLTGNQLNFISTMIGHLTKVECEYEGIAILKIQSGKEFIQRKLIFR